MPAVLEFQDILKDYRALFRRRTVRALDHFTLQVEEGEIFGFLGPNGAGKTTAIHLAMGFVRPTRGRGLMFGKRFGHAATRRRVGFLAENVALYHRPAETLVRFYGALNGLTGEDLARRTKAALELVNLTDESNRNVSKFSRGMLQRIGLAQAIVHDPDLLILDEPTSALDPLARYAVREMLLEWRNRGKTIFLSSHLLSEVELVCDRIAVLNHGRVVRLGRPADLLESHETFEVIAQGLPSGRFPEAEVQPGGRIYLRVSASEQRAVIERIWSLGGEVISVSPHKRSLEDLFLELTGGPTPKSGSELTSALASAPHLEAP
jgi:ABC-2 type transport system ATP-binding protein